MWEKLPPLVAERKQVLLSSSSEDSEIEKESGADRVDEEQGYESETEQPKEEDEKPSKKRKCRAEESQRKQAYTRKTI